MYIIFGKMYINYENVFENVRESPEMYINSNNVHDIRKNVHQFK